MSGQSLYHSFKRYRTLQTHRISALPIVILMPHSACNCRCVMCDIWKGNRNLKQLTEQDVECLLNAFKKFGTKQVVMSGGEALLNPNFFHLCQLLKKQGIHISVLSTGLTIKHHAAELVEWTDEVIVSLDGDEATHDRIRNIKGAFSKLKEGIEVIKILDPSFKISARTVIHKLNFRKWPEIIETAREIGLNGISFLPADVSSHAFNREIAWNEERQADVAISKDELPELRMITDEVISRYKEDYPEFIAESAHKLNNIFLYYSALHGLNEFPFKKCNAPWVSAVIEPDGVVRPCFFHEAIGNIRQNSLHEILNGDKGMKFRRELNMDENDTCKKCVCYLNLPARMNPVN